MILEDASKFIIFDFLMSARHNPEIHLYSNGTKSRSEHSNFRVRNRSSKRKCYYANKNNTFQIFKSFRQQNHDQKKNHDEKTQCQMANSKRSPLWPLYVRVHIFPAVWMVSWSEKSNRENPIVRTKMTYAPSSGRGMVYFAPVDSEIVLCN